MSSHIPPTPDAPVAATPAARFGASHGYRFDGDSVFLNASFQAETDADAGRAWSLRLVATPAAPADSAAVLAAQIVTEVALPPLAELTGAVDDFETVAGVLAPSSRGFHVLSLALVARDAHGAVTLYDTVTYPLAQAFAQPRLSGPVGLWFESDTELVLDLDHVENPREPGNQSGTLSVEVWALDHAYKGGLFEGQPIAGAILGCLAAGDSWQPGALHLHATRPANDRAHLVVMLREWNGVAYVTRDHVNFTPRTVAAHAPVAAEVPVAQALVVEVSAAVAAAPMAEVAVAASIPAVSVVAPAPAVVASTPAPVTVATITPTVSAAAPAATKAKATKATTAKSKVTPAAPSSKDGRVSINTASAAELTQIKGLSATLAAALIAARPLSRVEDLRLVKGFTPKTLEKVQVYLKV